MTEPTPLQIPEAAGTSAEVRTDETFRRRAAALGDETRLAIYRDIAGREVPVGVADLVADFGLNHNTVRQHLARLVDAGLVETVREPPRGPGRPPVHYRLTAAAAADWNDEGPYERLSMLLLEVASSDAPPREIGRRAGREMAVDVTHAADPLDAFTAAVTAQGFAPRTAHDTDGPGVELVLDHCPFARAAQINPGVVCALHRGMVEGLAERVGGLAVTDFVAADPGDAGCTVRIRRDDHDGPHRAGPGADDSQGTTVTP